MISESDVEAPAAEDDVALPITDVTCASAVAVARVALEEAHVPADDVGEHAGIVPEAEFVVTHLFDCTLSGYRGWRWAVTLNRLPESDHVTTNEIALVPGPAALLAPDWVPWRDRVLAGDIGPGDLLPSDPNDDRLVPGFSGTDDADAESDQLVPELWELGLGRARVMSVTGRNETAERWRAGPGGPSSRTARWAPEQCSTCAFMIGLAGPLGRAFGVCGNEFSPSDSQVVSVDHGCGAHSETPPAPPVDQQELLVVDDEAVDLVRLD